MDDEMPQASDAAVCGVPLFSAPAAWCQQSVEDGSDRCWRHRRMGLADYSDLPAVQYLQQLGQAPRTVTGDHGLRYELSFPSLFELADDAIRQAKRERVPDRIVADALGVHEQTVRKRYA